MMSKTTSYLLITMAFFSTWVQATEKDDVTRLLSEQAITFSADKFPFQQLGEWIGDRQIVLLGDSTHGSQEFYRYRAEISRYLITNHGFSTVIVEGNWPGGQRVNQYIHHHTDNSVNLALSGFKSYFPWLWRNQSMLEFVQWLHNYNRNKPQQAVSFYGMDLFSLTASITRNIELLKKHNTPFNAKLIDLYHCFSSFKNDSLRYGQYAAKNPQKSCQNQAEQQYSIISEHPDLLSNKAEYFDLRINSLIVQTAEQYFRMSVETEANEIWNLRERFMQKIFNTVFNQQKKINSAAKVIIWAHNSHAGDARATSMKEQKRESIGQLLRQQFGKQQVFLLGALSYQGEVMASKQWGGPANVMRMPVAIEGSYSHLFHQLNSSRFIMNFSTLTFSPFYQRFIGVVYVPEEEQLYHYNNAKIDQQFDALLFVDQTTAVQTLD